MSILSGVPASPGSRVRAGRALGRYGGRQHRARDRPRRRLAAGRRRPHRPRRCGRPPPRAATWWRRWRCSPPTPSCWPLPSGSSVRHGSRADAVRTAAAGYAEQLRGLGGYLAERADDVVDVGERLAASLEGRASAGLPDPGHPYVLVAADLAPPTPPCSTRRVVVGIVTEQGGPTSHTTILARSLGIPAVVACAGARDAADGHEVVARRLDRRAARRPRRRPRRGTCTRANGATPSDERGPPDPARPPTACPSTLLANVGTVDDALAAAAADVEGVGLFRTEFLFLGRDDEPTVRRAGRRLRRRARRLRRPSGGRPHPRCRIRQAGALPRAARRGEPGARRARPAHGGRAARRARAASSSALAAAAARTGTGPWVMAPMVTTVDEARGFAAQARGGRARHASASWSRCRPPRCAPGRCCAEVDFGSLGTNDLAQYALAADRQLGEPGRAARPVAAGAARPRRGHLCGRPGADRPVGVCGEAAADPRLAVVLVGLGVRSLSMAPVAVPGVRACWPRSTSRPASRRRRPRGGRHRRAPAPRS